MLVEDCKIVGDSTAKLDTAKLDTAFFSRLDAFEQAFVFLDDENQARFLSAKASRLLEIRRGEDLSTHQAVLEPLLNFNLKAKKRSSPQSFASPQGNEFIEECSVTTTSGRCFQAVAFSRAFEFPDFPEARIVVFHDLSVLNPFLKAIEQSRKNRALILLASAHLGRNLLFDHQGKDLSAEYENLEGAFFKILSSPSADLMNADLLTCLSTAVDIIDPLVSSSAKIVSEARTSALLGISQPNCLRILGHVLLEASDFVGPFGRISLKAELTKNNTAEVSLFAQRHTAVPLDASPLDLYVFRRYMPVQYKVTTVDEAPRTGAFEGVQFGTESVVPGELRSENINIASKIAKSCSCELMIKHPKAELLVLSLSFPLATGRL